MLWVFGLSTTVLLVGLWGRSVATDELTLEASAEAVLESRLVNERVQEWLTEGLATAAAVSEADVADVARTIAASPEADEVVDALVDDTVAALLAPSGSEITIDISEPARALAPVVADALRDADVDADPDAVLTTISNAPDIVLSTDDQQMIADGVRQTAGFMTRAAVIGLSGIVLAGGAAIGMSRDRTRQLRDLAVRLALSAVTFAVLLRVGAWAVDPGGGRSPVAAGGAVLLRSNGHVLAAVSLAAAVVAGAVSLALLSRRRSSRLDGAPAA